MAVRATSHQVARALRSLALSTALLPASAAAQANEPPRLSLQSCELPGVQGARCGVHHVPEDRRATGGRTIPLFVAVLPAREAPAAPDPLFVLSGGPGQGASALADFVDRTLPDVRRHRDLVFVDLAGTGRSAALRCHLYRTARDLVGDFYPIARVRACRDSLARHADLRRYVTPTLVDDLDEVRVALGYERINLYGTSYGTRAALEYVRRHRAHVRTIVLKAVAPHAMQGTMHYARDMERSLQYLFNACRTDAACSAAFPNVDAELREILRRADRGTLRGLVPDASGGPSLDLALSRGVVASTLLGLLQNSNTAVRVPLLVHTTFLGDTRPLADAIVRYRRGLDTGISFGMHLSVMCSEDAPRMDLARAAATDRGTALGDYRVRQLAAVCREWVKGEIPPDYATPVRSDVPALLVSGTLDPNTNERWGDEAARYLTRAAHVVIPNLSHGFSSIRECGGAFITTFLTAASAEGIDFSCKDRVRLPPFPGGG
jgi:pimeloyl-ACP methyl ester carboxylesterase